MRLRTALMIFAAFNVLWAAAFIGYMHRSNTPVVRPVNGADVAAPRSNAVVATPPTTQPVAVTVSKPNVAATPANSQKPAPATPARIASADKQFGWQDV